MEFNQRLGGDLKQIIRAMGGFLRVSGCRFSRTENEFPFKMTSKLDAINLVPKNTNQMFDKTAE